MWLSRGELEQNSSVKHELKIAAHYLKLLPGKFKVTGSSNDPRRMFAVNFKKNVIGTK